MVELEGTVHPAFQPLARHLSKLLAKSSRGGGALAVWHEGEMVADVWGGRRNEAGDPWRRDTLALSFSTTKGVASTMLHVLADRGLIDYEAPVATYWPEFAQRGKEEITVRQLMCHEAGLHRIRSMIDHARRMTDWDFMVATLERQRPAFRPGSVSAYHAITYGWLVGELVCRITGKSFSESLRELLAEPLGLDGLYCGLPESEMARRAELLVDEKTRRPPLLRRLLFWWWATVTLFFTFGFVNLFESARALVPKGTQDFDFNSAEVLKASIPAANGCFTARSLARLYAALANGGELDGVRLVSEETVQAMATVQNRRFDRVLIIPMHWRLGYHRVFSFGGPKSDGFAHFGLGGSGAWADPGRRLAFGFTVNWGVGTPMGDARVVSLTRKTLECADRRSRRSRRSR